MRPESTNPNPTNQKITRTDHRAGPAGVAAATEFQPDSGIRPTLAEGGETH